MFVSDVILAKDYTIECDCLECDCSLCADFGVRYPFDIACLYVPRPEGLSSATAHIADIAREGPFDAFASPMDTEDSPFVTTGLPGCPYRITSYNGPAISDMKPAFGLQLHHPRFLEFISAPESARLLYRSPMFWVDR